jgi:hypothetical protein
MPLKLSNSDLRWAHWRNIPAEAKPAAKPFMIEEALKTIQNIKTNYGVRWDYLKLDIGMSPEEAHFWLEAFAKSSERWGIRAEEIISHLTRPQANFDGQLSLKDIQQLLPTGQNRYASTGKIIIPLYRLLKLADFIQITESQLTGYYHQDTIPEVFRLQILPYLSPDEREAMRSVIRPYLNGTNFSLIPIAGLLGGFDQELEQYLDKLYSQNAHQSSRYWEGLYYAAFGLSTHEKVSQFVRKSHLRLWTREFMQAWLAHTELQELDWIAESVKGAHNKAGKNSAFGVFKKLVYPEAVPHVLSLWQEPQLASEALSWLVANPEIVAEALTPIALGSNGKSKLALKYLRRMVSMQQIAPLEGVMASLSEADKARFCSEVLEFHQSSAPELDKHNTPEWLAEAMAQQGKGTKTSSVDWVDILALPNLQLAGMRLNSEQIKHVLIALRGNNKAFIEQLKQHFSRQELDDFVWNVYENWEEAGAPPKDIWALNALGHLGGDAVVLKLSPLIKKWPGESKAKRAQVGISILQQIGSDTALMQINNIAQKIRFNGLKKFAWEAMDAIAKSRGFSQTELEDRIIPDGGLDEDGSRVFDFGSRKFTFVLSSDMKAMIREESGKLRDNLPKAIKTDDAALAAQAEADWKLIKKQIREVAKSQAERLENAMISQRRWALQDFKLLFVQHPLMFHIVRLLLWGAYDEKGKLLQIFRVDENRNFVDSDDEPVDSNDFKQVGVIHVMEVDSASQQTWGEILSDYELIPPFQQLGRKVSTLESGEENARMMTRFAPYKVEPVVMVSILEKSGWQRGAAQDAGMYYSHAKYYPFANLTAFVRYYGVPMGYWDFDKQGIDACFFVKGEHRPEGYSEHKEAEMLPLKDIPPVVLSETLRILHAIAGKAD